MSDRSLPKTQRETAVKQDNRGGLSVFIPEAEAETVAAALKISGNPYAKYLAEQITKYSKSTTAAPVA